MRQSLLLILVLLVSACAPMAQPQDPSSRPDQGLLVVSMRFSSNALTADSSTITNWASLRYTRAGAALPQFSNGFVSSRDARIAIDGEKFARLNVVPLTAGEYSFDQVEVAGLVAKLDPAPRFTIKAGRATYLGMVEVRVRGFEYRLNPSDEQARDIPLLLKHWPAVKRESIDVQVLPRS